MLWGVVKYCYFYSIILLSSQIISRVISEDPIAFGFPAEISTCSTNISRCNATECGRPFKYMDCVTKFPGASDVSILFNNPLPPGYLAKYLQISLWLSYKCGKVPPTISIIYQDLTEQVYEIPESYCHNCSNCVQLYRVPGEPPPMGYWQVYYKYGINTMDIRVYNTSLRVHSVIIDVFGVNVWTNISSIDPPTYPAISGGIKPQMDAYLFIHGSHLYQDTFLYYCEYKSVNGTESAVASVSSDMQIRCPVPKILTPQVITIMVYPHIEWTDPTIFLRGCSRFPYTFFKQPMMTNLLPKEGGTGGGENLTIYGEDFFSGMGSILACKFGDNVVMGHLINSSVIQCPIPPINLTKNQNVQVSVSENLLHWTSPLSFLYLAPVPFTPLQPIQFTWVKYASITLVVLCTICLIIYAISQKKLTHGYELVEEYIPIGREYVIDSEELKFEEIIGRGSFGNVYRGQWRHTEVAIKRIHNTSQSFIDELYREAELMIALRHPNIVTFMACTTKPDVCLVTEFISRGSLYGILHNKSILISPEHVRRMSLDACKGMEYLHSARIIHRDLKSHNLLVDKAWAIKVADFGLSRHLEESFAKEMTACGTPCWTAPEVIRNEHYDMSADVYSFGVCLWEMMSRSDPFPGMPPMQVVLAVAQNKQRPPIDPSWHPAICNIIQSCFEDKPTLRPTFGELILKLHSLDLPPAPPNPIILNLDERKSTDLAF